MRNILVHGNYTAPLKHRQTAASLHFSDAMESGNLSFEEVLRHYGTHIYARTRNFEETAKRVKLDCRTVKKYIDQEFLERLLKRI